MAAFTHTANAQIAAWNFTGLSNSVTVTSTNYNANLSAAPVLSRGAGAPASIAGNSFRTTGFQNNGISTGNTDYFQTTLSAASGFKLSLTSISAYLAGTASYSASPGTTNQFAYSLDGTNFTLIEPPVVRIGTGAIGPLDTSAISALQNVPAGTTVTLRFYATGQTSTGGWGFNSPSATTDGFSLAGVVEPSAGNPPIISSFSPLIGPVGTTVTINGLNFGASPTVKFNGVAAISTSVNPAGTIITATVPVGATTGLITVEVTGFTTATSATDFVVVPPGEPIISLSTNEIAGLNAATGSPSAATNYTVTGFNLGTNPVVITPDSTLLELGTNGTTFTSTLSLPPTGGAVSSVVYLRLAATNVANSYSANVDHVSGTASSSLLVYGSITNPAPALSISPTNLPGFSTTTGTPSAPQTFSVTGTFLQSDVTVSAPVGFEVAPDGTTWGTNALLVQSEGALSNTVSVRLVATNVWGSRSGTVFLVGTNLTTRRVAVSGTVAGTPPDGLVYWDFNSATPTYGTNGAYATWTFGPVTQGNNNGTTAIFTASSVSSGYTNPFNMLASGTTNAGAAARTGPLVTGAGGSAYFEAQITLPSNSSASITNISFGSRSTGTGPAAYAIRSGADNFASDLATGSLTTDSTWIMYVAPVSLALTNGTNTIRIYGYDGAGAASASSANWRIDDLGLALASAGPTISVSANSVSGLTATQGTPGAVTNFTASGANLVDDIAVSVPGPDFVLSTNPASGFTNSFVLARSGAGVATTPIYVRLTGTNVGTFTNTVSLASSNATTQNVTVIGTVDPVPVPTLTATPSTITNLGTTAGTPSDAQSFTASGTLLSNNITVSANDTINFAVSTNPTNGFAGSLVLSTNGSGAVPSTPVYVRLTGTNVGSFTNTVSLVSGALSTNVTVGGVVASTNDPFVDVDPASLSGFAAFLGSASATQSVSVNGVNLTGPVQITASPGFEISINGTTFSTNVSIPVSGGTVTFTNSTNWVAPAGVSFVQVECWGAGGAGGSALRFTNGGSRNYAGGGAGGAYAKVTNLSVTGGSTYAVNVGVGSSNSSNVLSNRVDGGDSWFASSTPPATNVLAKGGVGAISLIGDLNSGTTPTRLGVGGIGTTNGSIGDIVFAGGNGGNGSETNASATGGGGGGGSSAGTSLGGVSASNAIGAVAPIGGGGGGNGADGSANGTNGVVPGGGGGGGATSSTNINNLRSGGAGANGQVVVTTTPFFPATTVYVRMASTAPLGANSGNLTITSAGAATRTVSLSGVVNPVLGPTVTATPSSLSAFTTSVGTPSTAQTFNASGSNLSGDITITAPPGYAVSATGTTFATSVTLTPSGGTVASTSISVRLTGASAGSPSGNVTVASTGATTQNVAVSGTVNTPTVTASPATLNGFSTTLGAPSTAQTFNASGSNLSGNITITAPTGYAVSTNGTTFTNLVTLAQTGGTVASTSISVRLTGASAGSFSGNVTVASTNATTQNVALSGTVNTPTVTASVPSLALSNTTLGTPSAAQSFNAGGTNLLTNITVTAIDATNFAVSTNSSTGFTNALILTNTGGAVASTPVYVRLTGTNLGTFSNTVSLSSSNAVTQSVAITGTVDPVPVPTLTATPSSITNFATIVGTASDAQPFTASGTALSNNITVSANDVINFAVSTNSTNGFTNSVVLTNSGGTVPATPVFVRLTGAAKGTFTNTVSFSSGALSTSVTVGGVVSGTNDPNVTVTPASLGGFTAVQGTNSTNQTVTISGTNLTGLVSVTAAGGFEVSTNGTNFSPSVNVLPLPLVPAGTNTFTVSTNWTAPSNTIVAVECWGAGGAGGSAWRNPASGSVQYGGGGAGGAYAKIAAFSVAAGSNYTVNVGLGASNTSDTNQFRFDGADSWFNSTNTILAKGGQGGQSAIGNVATTRYGAGGIGTTNGSFGDVIFAGGNGFSGWSVTNTTNVPPTTNYGGGGGGSSAGFAAIGTNALYELGATNGPAGSGNGGNGITNGSNPGGAGGFPGGGGGGPRSSSLLQAGGAGGNGKVVLTTLVSSPVLSNTTIYVRMAASAVLGTNTGSLTIASSGASDRTVTLGGFATPPPPAVSVSTNSLPAFSTPLNVPSSFQSFTAGGTSLTSNITVTAPANFVVSLTNDGTGVGPSVTLTSSGGIVSDQLVFVRMTGATVGSFSGPVSLVGGSASNSVAVSGNVLAPVITTSTNALPAFSSTTNVASAAQSFLAQGTNLSTNITVAPPQGFSVALTTNTSDFTTNTITLTNSNNAVQSTLVYVRMEASSVTNSLGPANVVLSSTGASNTNVTVSGIIRSNSPSLTVSTNNLINFFTSAGTASAAQSYTLSGSNIFSGVTVAAPAGFQVALTNTNSAFSNSVSPVVAGGLLNTNIFVRVSASAATSTNLTGSVTNTAGVATTNVSLQAIVAPTPVVSAAPTTLSNFSTVTGIASTNQSFSLTASNLLGPVNLSVTNGYEMSTSTNSGFATNLAVALISASDLASNYTTATWTNGANQGTGFGPWALPGSSGVGTNGFNGAFVGTAISTLTNYASLYTGGVAFAIYAGGTNSAYQDADRTLSRPLAVGETLTHSFGIAFDNGNKGFDLYDGTNQVFNFNVNDAGYSWTGGNTSAPTPYTTNREFGVVINFSFTRTTNGFTYAISSLQDTNLTRTGSLTNGGIDRLKYYISGAGGGDAGNIYFNNFQVSYAGGNISNLPIYVRIATNAPIAEAPTNLLSQVTISTTNALSNAVVNLTGNVADLPSISVSTNALADFVATNGTASPSQFFSVSGHSLTNDIVLTADPANATNFYQISTNNAAFTNTLTLARSNGIVASNTIYVRIGTNAPVSTNANSLLGNVALSSPDATNNVSLSGRVFYKPTLTVSTNALPRIFASLGVPSSPAVFSVAASNLFGNVTVALSNATGFRFGTNGIDFGTNPIGLVPVNGSLSNTIYVQIPGTVPIGSYTNSISATSLGADPQTVSVVGTVSDKPAITNNASFTNFFAIQTFPSDPQTFSVGGNLLEDGILVSAPAGYQISSNQIVWTNSFVIPRDINNSAQQNVAVRLASTNPVGAVNGSLMLSSTNATSATIPLSGVVASNTGAQLAANPALLAAFTTDVGTSSAAQTFALTGQGLSNSVSLSAPSGFVLSTDGTAFVSNSTVTPRASGFLSNTISVRMTGAALGIFGGNVAASSGAASASVAVQGTVYGVGANITASPTNLTGFTTVEGTPSATQSFKAGARNLGTTNLVATASPGYEISTNSTNFFVGSVTNVPVAGAIDPLSLYVRITASAGTNTNLTGTVTLSGGTNIPAVVALSGNVDPLRPPSVTLVAPSNNPTTIAPGSTIRLRATALDTNVSGGAGTIATFQFLTNGVPIPGASTSNLVSPATFQYDWTPSLGALPAAVSARAVDTDGLQGNSPTTNVVRFPDPGEPVVGFTPPIAYPTLSQIEAVAPATNGAFYLGGSFTNFVRTVGGISTTNVAMRVARILADGTVDSDFVTDAGPNNTVRTLLYSATNQGLYIGGAYTNVSGVSRPGLARLAVGQTNIDDGTLDTNFAPALGGVSSPIVNAVVQQYDGKILAGGIFATAGAGTNSASSANLARFLTNGVRDASFTPPEPNGEVKSIALQPDGKILIAGSFAQVAGQARKGLARLNIDGTLDTTFTVGTGASGGFNGTVWSVAVALDGSIYAGGQFSSYNGKSVYNNLAKLSATGDLQTKFNYAGALSGGINNVIRNVQMRPGGDILVSGLFTQIANSVLFPTPVAAGRVAEFVPAGTLDATFNPGGVGANNSVLSSSTLANGNLVLVGAFTQYNGQSYPRMVVLSGASAASSVVTSQPFFTVDAGAEFIFSFTSSGAAPYATNGGAQLPRGVSFDSVGKVSGIPLDAGEFDMDVSSTVPGGGLGNPSTFRLQVLPKIVPYDTWKKVWFAPADQTNATVSGPLVNRGNPSGQPNFTVYALSGGNPREDGPWILPEAAPEYFEGQQYLGYTVWRYPLAEATYTVQTSGNLQTWGTNTVTITNTSDYFQVRPTVPMSLTNGQFFRLKISTP